VVRTDARRSIEGHGGLTAEELLGCDRLVSFGDGANDQALFAVSDECYAVENAVPELRAVATG